MFVKLFNHNFPWLKFTPKQSYEPLNVAKCAFWVSKIAKFAFTYILHDRKFHYFPKSAITKANVSTVYVSRKTRNSLSLTSWKFRQIHSFVICIFTKNVAFTNFLPKSHERISFGNFHIVVQSHSVETSELIFSHSDFTWNQCWRIWTLQQNSISEIKMWILRWSPIQVLTRLNAA